MPLVGGVDGSQWGAGLLAPGAALKIPCPLLCVSTLGAAPAWLLLAPRPRLPGCFPSLPMCGSERPHVVSLLERPQAQLTRWGQGRIDVPVNIGQAGLRRRLDKHVYHLHNLLESQG